MKGWHRESIRHSLARRGFRTSYKITKVKQRQEAYEDLFSEGKKYDKREADIGRNEIVFYVEKGNHYPKSLLSISRNGISRSEERKLLNVAKKNDWKIVKS